MSMHVFYEILTGFSQLELDTDTIHLYSTLEPENKDPRAKNMTPSDPSLLARTASLAELKATLGDLLAPARQSPESNQTPETEAETGTQQHAQTATRAEEEGVLKKIFPHGLPAGELIEILHRCFGSGTLALCLARIASRDGRAIAVLDPSRQFYPHPATAIGIAPQQLIILHTKRSTEAIWALEQAVRCRGFAAVLWRAVRPTLRHLRRLQHACKQYDTLGLLLRAETTRRQPTAARTRLRVTATAAHRPGWHASPFFPHRLCIERLRGAHLAAGNRIELEMDYASGTFRQAPSLPLAP